MTLHAPPPPYLYPLTRTQRYALFNDAAATAHTLSYHRSSPHAVSGIPGQTPETVARLLTTPPNNGLVPRRIPALYAATEL